MTSSGKKKLAAFAVLAMAGGALSYFALMRIDDNLVYYLTPSDLLAKPEMVRAAGVRLGGMVQKGTLQWDAAAMHLRFVMGEKPEGGGATVAVEANGVPPQLLREGIGCIVEGTYDGRVFHADRLMVKHSNEYKPPQEGDDLRRPDSTLQPETHPYKDARTGVTP